MNASHCPAYIDMFDQLVECERELHGWYGPDSEHRAVVYGEAYPGGDSLPVTVRWSSK